MNKTSLEILQKTAYTLFLILILLTLAFPDKSAARI